MPAPTERVAPQFDWIEAIDLPTPDGEKIVAWYAAPQNPACPTLMFFHGNASRIDWSASRYKRAHDNGLGVIAIAYRGYSGSTGKPGEKRFHVDSQTAWDWLTQEKHIPPNQIIVHGHSMGSGVAVQLAARETPAALIMESPFYSMASTAQHHAKFLPASLIVKHKFQSNKHIPNVTAPILMAHGTDDVVVPISQSQRLLELAPEPTTYKVFEGGDHNSLEFHGLYEKAIWPFLAHIFPNCTSLQTEGASSS